MTVTAAGLVATFPEFGNAARYSPDQIANWLDIASALVPARRWIGTAASGKSMLDLGIELFAAHHLAVERRNADEALNGAPPGSQVGALSGKSVGPASMQYDVGNGVPEQAGHWSMTNYGTRFLALARMFGAGPIQVGIGCGPPLSGGGAWAGPPVWVPAWFTV